MSTPVKVFLTICAVAVAVACLYFADVFGVSTSYAAEACVQGSFEQVVTKADTLRSAGGKLATSDDPAVLKGMKAAIEKQFPEAVGNAQVEEEWSRTVKVSLFIRPDGEGVFFLFDAKGCIVDYVIGINVESLVNGGLKPTKYGDFGV